MSNGHWNKRGDSITSLVRNSGHHEEIAIIVNDRACRQLIRYSQLGEEAEYFADQLSNIEYKFYNKVLTEEQARDETVKLAHKMRELVRNAIQDTTVQPVVCGEVYNG